MAASYFSESFLFIIVNSFDNKTLMKWIDCHVQHFLYKESALVDRFDALAITWDDKFVLFHTNTLYYSSVIGFITGDILFEK